MTTKKTSFLEKNSKIVLPLVIFVVAIYLYNMFLKPSAPQATSGGVNAGADLVELFVSVQSVDLDPSLFNSSVYKSLSDFSVTLISQPTGRANPFGLLGQ